MIGVLDSVARQSDLLGAVIIPEGTAQREYHVASPEKVAIETDIGAATVVAGQVRTALRPDDPKALRVAFPAEPKRVRDEVKATSTSCSSCSAASRCSSAPSASRTSPSSR